MGTMNEDNLLLIDGAVNLALGALLVAFPRGLVQLLGIPDAPSSFYPNILGAILFGIGIALLIERYRHRVGLTGLGLAGAVAINLCGGLILALWLTLGELSIPTRGTVILGALAVLLVGISGVELRAQLRSDDTGENA
jgi:hypothetical protein